MGGYLELPDDSPGLSHVDLSHAHLLHLNQPLLDELELVAFIND